MAVASSKLLSHLRRRSLLRSSPSLIRTRHLLPPPTPIHSPRFLDSLDCPLPSTQSPFQFSRCFSASSWGDDSGLWRLGESASARSELDGPISSGLNEAAHEVVSSVSDGGSILPVKSLISILDYCHDLTGFPWWALIASSTIAMRIMLLPIVVLQQKKLSKIAEFLPKLPPPLPPLFSGKSYSDHISHFKKERRASGCPTLLWMLATSTVQIPFFMLWMVTTRRMSLDNHPGFDSGGILWFQNLTEVPQGTIGLILPFLIGGLHLTNVQVAFSRFRKYPSTINVIARGYRIILQILTLPVVYGSCLFPQASLVYWATNITSSILVQMGLHHPGVRMMLGLSKEEEIIPKRDSNADMAVTSKTASSDSKIGKTSVHDLSPEELLALSLSVISQGENIQGISLLELALDKDPEYIRAMVVIGQTLLHIEEPDEAAEYLERAISKLFGAGNPMEKEGEELDFLILASQGAGLAYIQQSKFAEGIEHLERIAALKEPEEPKIKAHYYDGLVLLSSALFNEGRTAEAAKYLRLAAAYDPKFNELLEQCEKESRELNMQ
ncbi:ALBINO3-like protein 2, chloroplastic [Punica granatum]|uniref:ALBINO3-like protein 2, chloroplastic n=1 Tax=Punica granatum TaxID=22663 RepID=A0A6P8E4A6_PUNGR|nr:ALBINO3-like protein 2, chloroplastic [Punica granatum]